MDIQRNTCRSHDKEKQVLESAFVPIYSMMFIFSVFLNSLLLYIVIKKEHFVHEKRAFHKLFQTLIALDLMISILILPQILIKVQTEDHDVHIGLDAYLMVRDFAISSQMIILVLIAIDRLLAFLVPLGNCWRLEYVNRVLYVTLSLVAIFNIIRFILLSVSLDCSMQISVDRWAKFIFGISGGAFMLSNFIMYFILFVLLCKRQVKRQRLSLQTMQILKINTEPNSNSVDGNNVGVKAPLSKPRSQSRISLTKGSLSRRIGSIKFAKVLFGVNILMITSYLPGIMYNGKVIKFPSYTVYYLFFLHALGDPILFFLTRPELKRGLLNLFKSRN